MLTFFRSFFIVFIFNFNLQITNNLNEQIQLNTQTAFLECVFFKVHNLTDYLHLNLRVKTLNLPLGFLYFGLQLMFWLAGYKVNTDDRKLLWYITIKYINIYHWYQIYCLDKVYRSNIMKVSQVTLNTRKTRFDDAHEKSSGYKSFWVKFIGLKREAVSSYIQKGL